MKNKIFILISTFAVLTGAYGATGTLSAPIPEFQNYKTRAEETRLNKPHETRGANQENFFYTGKPIDEKGGGYMFKYRSYDPELSRWASVDPSGFPDGANNFIFVQNGASFALDAEGLVTIRIASVTGSIFYNHTWRENYTSNGTMPLSFSWVNTTGAKTENYVSGISLADAQLPELPDAQWIEEGVITSVVYYQISYTNQPYNIISGSTRDASQNVGTFWKRNYSYSDYSE